MKIKKRVRVTLQDQLIDFFKEKRKIKISKTELCKLFDVKDKRTITHALESLEHKKAIRIKKNIVDGVYTRFEYTYRGIV